MKQAAMPIILRLLVFVGLLGLQSIPARAGEDACPETAQQYWQKFRASVHQSNLIAITDVSYFPFVIHGTLDDSEKRSVDREEFIKIFPALLEADPGLSPAATTMKSLVETTLRLTPSHCKANQFRVGDWVFHLTSEGWRFVEAYIDN
ncbi:MAG: hypothetical protein LBE22_05430 [Azoarcus sp.]|jgi:hypothetical protein|nr:hypothetical protein [Azoarcus sp.]